MNTTVSTASFNQSCAVAQTEAGEYAAPSDWFYTRWMGLFMRWLVDTVDDKTIQQVGKIVVAPDENSTLIKDALAANGVVLFIFILLILVSVALFVAIVVVAICRWFCPKNKGITPDGCQMVTTLISFAICGLGCAGGILIFLICINNARNSIEKIPIQLNKTSMSLGVFIEGYGTNLDCTFENENNKLNQGITQAAASLNQVVQAQIAMLDTKFIDDVQDKLRSIKTVMSGIQNTSAFPADFVDKMNNLTSSPLLTQMDPFKKEMKDLSTKMSGSGNVQNMTAKAKELSKEQKKLLTSVVTEITNKANKLQDIMSKAISNPYYSDISFYLQFTVIIPFSLFCLIAGGFVFLLLRFMCNCCGDDDSDEKDHPRRGCISSIAGHILGMGGYLAMFTGSLLFAMAAAGFSFAFASMFLCVGLFDDPELRFFQAISQFDQSQQMGKMQINISMHDTFIKCKNGYTFFDAIDGNYQMAREQVKSELTAFKEDTLWEAMEKFTTPPHLETSLKEARDIVKEETASNSSLNTLAGNTAVASLLAPEIAQLQGNLTELKKRLKVMDDRVQDLQSRARLDDMTNEIDESIMQIEDAIIESIASTLKAVLDMSPQCDNLMNIWDDIGNHICTEIATPVQGLWMALVLSGIASFSVFNQLFKSTKYLKDFTDPDDKKKNRSKGSRSRSRSKSAEK